MTAPLALALALSLAGAAPAAVPASAPGPAAAPAKARGRPGPAPTVLTLQRPAGKEWFGLYLVGKKAGYTWSQVRREVRDGHPVLVTRQETELTVDVGGKTVKRAQSDEKVFEAAPRGRLLSFRSRRSGDGGERTVDGRCDAKGCTLTLVADGGTETRRIPAPGENAEQADAARLAAARRGLVRGPQLDLEQLRVRQVEDRFRERRTVGAGGVEVRVAVVEEREVGDRTSTELSIAPDGRILELRLGGSVVARAEPEAVARRLDQVDLFSLTRVPLPGPLPRDVPLAIVYRLRGLPAGFRLDDARQRTEPAGPGETLLTVTARTPAAADPARDAPRTPRGARAGDPLLAPGSSAVGEIDSDAPAIRRLAAEGVGDARGSYAAALRLNRLVFERLRKVFGASRDKASEVLAAGEGDCTEHSLLLTALARAAGIPARPVYGLVYTRYGAGGDGLYWHAWVEVRSGEEWIALDPTFGEPVADATHVALGRASQVDAMALLGSLKVISADPRPVR